METAHSQVATTKPPPLPPGALHRAPSEQRRLPKDTARVPPHTKAPQRTQDQAATNTTVATEREAHERPSTRSAATQTHDSPEATAVFATPPRTNACTQTQEAEVVVAGAAAAAAAGAPPPSWAPGRGTVFSGSFPLPADPARLAERIRHSRSQLSAAFDDTEYEPYGLPEVVMKGEWRKPPCSTSECVVQQTSAASGGSDAWVLCWVPMGPGNP